MGKNGGVTEAGRKKVGAEKSKSCVIFTWEPHVKAEDAGGVQVRGWGGGTLKQVTSAEKTGLKGGGDIIQFKKRRGRNDHSRRAE